MNELKREGDYFVVVVDLPEKDSFGNAFELVDGGFLFQSEYGTLFPTIGTARRAINKTMKEKVKQKRKDWPIRKAYRIIPLLKIDRRNNG